MCNQDLRSLSKLSYAVIILADASEVFSVFYRRSVLRMDVYNPSSKNTTAAKIPPRPRLSEKSPDEIPMALVGSGVTVTGAGVSVLVISTVGDGCGVLVSIDE